MTLSLDDDRIISELADAELPYARRFLSAPPDQRLELIDALAERRGRVRGVTDRKRRRSGMLWQEPIGELPAPRPRYRSSECAPIVLKLSRNAETLRKLRDLLEQSQLPAVQFSEWVLGRDERTIYRYMAGGKIPRAQREWIRRLVRVELCGDEVSITVSYPGARGPRWRKKKTRVHSPDRDSATCGSGE